MLSSFCKKFNTSETLSNFCVRMIGFLLKRGKPLPDKTSANLIRKIPSAKSVA
jgi:hypothetical protein